MNQERVSQGELDRVKFILQSEHDVIFFPKREVVMPIIKRESVVNIAGEHKTDISMRAVTSIENYLKAFLSVISLAQIMAAEGNGDKKDGRNLAKLLI